MRTNNSNRSAVLLFFCLITLTGCVKEEDDFAKEITPQTTFVEGSVYSMNGEPLPGVKVQVDFYTGRWLSYSKTRHKAETHTDKNGKYRLFFNIKEDEQYTQEEKEQQVIKGYTLIYHLESLDTKKYILPADLHQYDSSGNPATTLTRNHYSFERSRTYTDNLYVSRKREIRITLQGFDSQKPHDYFELSQTLPYGRGQATTDISEAHNLAVMYGMKLDYPGQKSITMPFALNEENAITLRRMKDGVYSTEEIHLFVTEETPEELTYDF